MHTSIPNLTTEIISATNVRFEQDQLLIDLCDGREIPVPLSEFPWLNWLANASPEQKVNWSLEPGGFAIYWPDLDDGIEIEHLLSLYPHWRGDKDSQKTDCIRDIAFNPR